MYEESEFIFPSLPAEVVVETDLMVEMETRTLAVFHLGLFLLWYGSAGVGKTTTIQWMVRRINFAYKATNPNAFKAVILETGRVKAGWGNEAKRVIRSLYRAIAGIPIDEGLYGRQTAEELADLVVGIAQRRCIRLIFIDEAGRLSLDAIDGLILVSNKARELKFPISFVLVGMDDLPQKIESRPQSRRRFADWCHFQHYSLEETVDLLAALHPHFDALDLDNRKDLEQIKFVHEISGGLPGFIIPFVARFNAQYEIAEEAIDIVFLRGIHLASLQEKKIIRAQAKRNGLMKLAESDLAAEDGKKTGKKTTSTTRVKDDETQIEN